LAGQFVNLPRAHALTGPFRIGIGIGIG